MSEFVPYDQSKLPSESSAFYQVLRPDGTLAGKSPDLPHEFLFKMYKRLLHARALDQKIVNLSMRREVSSYPSYKGQEATQVGFASALDREDWFAPSYRDSAAMATFGFPTENLLEYFAGDERAMRIPEGVNLLLITSPVSAQVLHAVGLAQAMKIRRKQSVVIASTGDGGTSKGDFHEGLNYAGVNRLPVVFAVENNQWALSVPRALQTASKTLAQKAIAYGFEGLLVDGNDLIASYLATSYAVDKARRGDGPTLLEFVTYRQGPHATADLVSDRLKSKKEIAEWEKKDPLKRMEAYLRRTGGLDDTLLASIVKSVETEVEDAVARFRATNAPDPSDIFRHVYDRPSESLIEEWKGEGWTPDSYPEAHVTEPTVTGGKPGVNIRNAVNMALRQEMQKEGRIVVFGA